MRHDQPRPNPDPTKLSPNPDLTAGRLQSRASARRPSQRQSPPAHGPGRPGRDRGPGCPVKAEVQWWEDAKPRQVDGFSDLIVAVRAISKRPLF